MPAPSARLLSSRVVLLAIATLALTASATVVISESIEDMTARSPLVVRATVQQSQTSWSDGERKIWTWTELTVTETLKGKANGAILVKQPGGVVGNIGQHVAGAARFREGEDVVLFLEPATDERGVFIVRGLSAGKVAIVDRMGAKLAVRDLDGITFARRGPADGVQVVNDGELLGAPDVFLARVRRAVKGGTR